MLIKFAFRREPKCRVLVQHKYYRYSRSLALRQFKSVHSTRRHFLPSLSHFKNRLVSNFWLYPMEAKGKMSAADYGGLSQALLKTQIQLFLLEETARKRIINRFAAKQITDSSGVSKGAIGSCAEKALLQFCTSPRNRWPTPMNYTPFDHMFLFNSQGKCQTLKWAWIFKCNQGRFQTQIST